MWLLKWLSIPRQRFRQRTKRIDGYASYRTSWPVAVATESLETRCLLHAGHLDPSFGIGGLVTTENLASGNSLAIQNDGKIIVAGTAFGFALARYDTDGSLDSSFGSDGNVITNDFGQAFGESVAIQNDGKIVVTGSISVSQFLTDFALIRYEMDGHLDTTFGDAGIVRTSFGGQDFAHDVKIQNDGKIVVAGTTSQRGTADFALARYNTDGTLDPTFGLGGIVTTDFGNSDFGNSIGIQDDGRIVVAGEASGSFAVARYNSDGSLDTSFGDMGKVKTYLGRVVVGGNMALQSDGKIVVAGTAFFTTEDFALARYNTDGSLDTTFGGTGKIITDFGGEDVGNSVAIQRDGKIVVTGLATNDTNFDFGVVRYNVDGGLDTTFGGTGRITTDFGAIEGGRDVKIQSDGKIIVAGLQETGNVHFALARYDNTIVDEPPTVTSVESVSVSENTTDVITVAAADPENATLNYSLAGGADAALFKLNAVSGVLSFKSAPDFKNPADIDHDNIYHVTVNVSDGVNTVTQEIQVSVVKVNESPTIASADTASIAENTSFVFNVTGSDPEGHSPLYGIVGGPDQLKFTLNFLTGALSFISPSDFENPTDANHDNTYEVTVAVSDGINLVSQTISVSVTNANEAPTVTTTSSASVSENLTTVLTVSATDPEHDSLSYSLIGGVDQALFSIDPANGTLSFKSAPDFENPTDSDHNNVYLVTVQVSDGTNVVTQDVQVTVTNVAESIAVTLPVLGGSFTALFVNGQVHVRRSGKSVDVIAPVTIDGFQTVQFQGSNRNDRLTFDRSMNNFTGKISFNGLDGNDSLDARAVGHSVTFTGGNGNDTFLGGSGNDSVDGGSGNDSLTGGSGNDSINGGADNDRLTGDTGNDLLRGGTGNDSLSGGKGNDTLVGDAGRDTLKGDTGNDVIDGGDDNDILQGSDGDDSLRGGSGNDTLFGGTGNDMLLGSAGNDQLFGETGIDTLLGESGNDLLFGGIGLDIINVGSGRDTISDASRLIDASFAFDFDALLTAL